MNEVLQELIYIEDFLEFASNTTENMQSYLFAEGLATMYDGVVLVTKKGQKYITNNSDRHNNYHYDTIDLDLGEEPDYDDLKDDEMDYLKGYVSYE